MVSKGSKNDWVWMWEFQGTYRAITIRNGFPIDFTG